MDSDGADGGRPAGLLDRWADRLVKRRRRGAVVPAAGEQITRSMLESYLAGLGQEGDLARELDQAVDDASSRTTSLSTLTADLALQYLDRLQAPIPSLDLGAGVEAITRGYLACEAVQTDPSRFGATSPPEPLRLPPLRRSGAPPQDLLNRAFKASRRSFGSHQSVPPAVWDGYTYALTRRIHQRSGANCLLQVQVVDGLARLGWMLRLVDDHYGQVPERPA